MTHNHDEDYSDEETDSKSSEEKAGWMDGIQSGGNRFTIVKWCKWNPMTKDKDEGIIFVPVADMLDRYFKNALHIFSIEY